MPEDAAYLYPNSIASGRSTYRTAHSKLLPQIIAQGDGVDEKDKSSNKNCASEAPEGDSIHNHSALCNAGDRE
jgi:hypothetical protein